MSNDTSHPQESSSNWLPSDLGEDESSLKWFAYDSRAATGENDGSSSGCDPKATLTIVGPGFYDFRKAKFPEWIEAPRVKAITKRLNELQVAINDTANRVSANGLTVKDANDLEAYGNECVSLANELEKMNYTSTPLIPIPAGPGITLTLTSSPSDLAGSIAVTTTNVRAGKKNENKGLGEFFPTGSESGKTGYSAEFVLSGNYGTAIFQGSVSCCGIEKKSNSQSLIIDGMCKGEAQRDLDTFLTNFSTILDWAQAAMAAVFAAIAVALALLAAALAGGTGGAGSGPAALSALLALASALIALQIKTELDQKRAAFRKKITDEVQPYIDSLPQCP